MAIGIEVDDILNEMGILAEEPMLLPTRDATPNAGFVHSENVGSFVPVSPDRKNSEYPFHSTSSQVTVYASNVENLKTFSVPNPIAALADIPQTITTKDSALAQVTSSSSESLSSVESRVAESTNRKRKLSPEIGSESKELSEQQMEERRQRNREHAKRSRQRKKSFTKTLESAVEQLKEDNKQLREKIYAAIGKSKVEALLLDKRAQSLERFVTDLKNPKNRILDDSSVSVLKSLKKNLPSHVNR